MRKTQLEELGHGGGTVVQIKNFLQHEKRSHRRRQLKIPLTDKETFLDDKETNIGYPIIKRKMTDKKTND